MSGHDPLCPALVGVPCQCLLIAAVRLDEVDRRRLSSACVTISDVDAEKEMSPEDAAWVAEHGESKAMSAREARIAYEQFYVRGETDTAP